MPESVCTVFTVINKQIMLHKTNETNVRIVAFRYEREYEPIDVERTGFGAEIKENAEFKERNDRKRRRERKMQVSRDFYDRKSTENCVQNRMRIFG